MRPRIVIASLIFAAWLYGQDPAATTQGQTIASMGPFESAIIPVKTLTGDAFNRLTKLLSVFGIGRFQADENLHTIVVYAPKEVIEQMRKLVEQLDQPGSAAAVGRNIDMTLTFLRCSTKAPEQPAALPADLEPVAKQLRAATQYKDFELWETLPMRLQEGKEAQESLRLPAGLPADIKGISVIGNIKIHPEAVMRKDQGRYVRFSSLQIGLRVPYVTGQLGATPQYQYADVGLTTSGDFMEGQKTVLGKVSGIDDETSVFVVISLKVLD